MINFRLGQLWWCSRFPFTNRKYQGKPRPVVIVKDVNAKYVDAIMVTSYTDLPWRIEVTRDYYSSEGDKITRTIIKGKKFETELWEDDIKLKITKDTGLDEPSAARMITIARVNKNTLIEFLGNVEDSDLDKIVDKLKYIESQYFKNPMYFAYWMNRNIIEYSGILSLNQPVKPLSSIIDSNSADSFDIAMAVRHICNKEKINNTIGIVVWETDHGFNTHVICGYKLGNGNVGSVHCFYDGIAAFIKARGSFKTAIKSIFNIFTRYAGYGKLEPKTCKILENDKLEWLDQNCHKMSKLDIFGEFMGPWAQSIILDQANLL